MATSGGDTDGGEARSGDTGGGGTGGGGGGGGADPGPTARSGPASLTATEEEAATAEAELAGAVGRGRNDFKIVLARRVIADALQGNQAR